MNNPVTGQTCVQDYVQKILLFLSPSPGVLRVAVNTAGGAHSHGVLSTATALTPATEELHAIAVRKDDPLQTQTVAQSWLSTCPRTATEPLDLTHIHIRMHIPGQGHNFFFSATTHQLRNKKITTQGQTPYQQPGTNHEA